tara:strand:+ start:335 stop:1099 length:765 start_codon:yes stop_codon:yes gene_type:complete
MTATAWKGRLDDARLATAFLTRLPLSRHAVIGPAALARAVWAFPLAGLLVGGAAAVVYGAALAVGLAPWLAGALAILSQILLTGGLHEDGLADSADGLGGRDRQHRLIIMRDSATGSFGVIALSLSLMLRAGALAALADSEVVAGALIASATLSRAAIGLPMILLPPARTDGLSAEAGRPTALTVLAAWILAFILCFPGLAVADAIALSIAALAAALSVSSVARRRLGGQTGDVLGATQQVTELMCLLLLCSIA